MQQNKTSLLKVKGFLEKLQNDGKTTMIVAEGRKVIGVADAVKEDSRQAIEKLARDGYRTVMITGDNERTAKAVAREVGIHDVIANVLPEDKVKKVEELQVFPILIF